METGQIIVLIVLTTLVFIVYFGAACKIDYERKGISGLLYICLLTFIALLTLLLFGITLDIKADLEKKLKSKCPEYERIDNVYKLKE